MLEFAICLGCAGALLSLVARLPVLVAAVFLMVLALISSTALSYLGFEMLGSLPWTVVVAIVSLQIGYGLGVVARAILRPLFADMPKREFPEPRKSADQRPADR